MNRLKNILLLLPLAFAMFTLANGTPDSKIAIQKENQKTEFSKDVLYGLASLQPETVHHFVSSPKTGNFSTAGFTEPFTFIFRDLSISRLLKTFVFHDVNRCESVSKLLFPYHFFL